MDKEISSSLAHLRISFSVLLMPVFLLSLALNHGIYTLNTLKLFLALHLFVYPGSNGINSYYDRDKHSIGGLDNPPPIAPSLYYLAHGFSLAGILLAYSIQPKIGLLVTLYVLISTMYSHYKIRFKADTLLALTSVALFQGGAIFMAGLLLGNKTVAPLPFALFQSFAVLSILASYPLTQLAQKVEDAERGDKTLIHHLSLPAIAKFILIFQGLSAISIFLACQAVNQIELLLFMVPALLVIGLYTQLKVIVPMLSNKMPHANNLKFSTRLSAYGLNISLIAYLLFQYSKG